MRWRLGTCSHFDLETPRVAVAGRTGESVSVLTERLQQTLALTLQRENARAVLRRAGDAISPTVSLESP